ncbi:hypothetical protein [Ligaoa zhengdingensis]|jgi:gp66, putative|uniref:hypothetical protein n=1 Tax=Ligaoa zhengdingensis TaxID=2763658 RepID=UPI00205C6344|nr:MAG TPA: phosphoadenosine-phosphosulfate reductase [Caudoviricetes sp.]
MNQVEKAIVCFSGGHSSALAAIEAVRRYGKDKVILLNHDMSPKVEHEDIKRFKREVADYCGVPVTYANMPGWETTTPLDVCVQHKTIFAGRPGRAICTARLKTEPFNRWLESNMPKSADIHILYGFDVGETDRILRRGTIIRAMGYTPEFPLAQWPRTIERTEDIGIERPATYRIYRHANCIGCLKAGKQHWYCVYCLRPDIWWDAKFAEERLGYSIINGVYLKELEPLFWSMKHEKHICPSEKMPPQTFWAQVNATLPEQESMMPCDCAF